VNPEGGKVVKQQKKKQLAGLLAMATISLEITN